MAQLGAGAEQCEGIGGALEGGSWSWWSGSTRRSCAGAQ
jgi:hypothetical protein